MQTLSGRFGEEYGHASAGSYSPPPRRIWCRNLSEILTDRNGITSSSSTPAGESAFAVPIQESGSQISFLACQALCRPFVPTISWLSHCFLSSLFHSCPLNFLSMKFADYFTGSAHNGSMIVCKDRTASRNLRCTVRLPLLIWRQQNIPPPPSPIFGTFIHLTLLESAKVLENRSDFRRKTGQKVQKTGTFPGFLVLICGLARLIATARLLSADRCSCSSSRCARSCPS
jgi:hypothetical protein